MLKGGHSAILSTVIKLPVVIKTFVLSIFEWPLYTYFTVINKIAPLDCLEFENDNTSTSQIEISLHLLAHVGIFSYVCCGPLTFF